MEHNKSRLTRGNHCRRRDMATLTRNFIHGNHCRRWDMATASLGSADAAERADFLRDALLTHIELVKRRALEAKVGGLHTHSHTRTHAHTHTHTGGGEGRAGRGASGCGAGGLLHDALLTHIELVKRRALEAKVGGLHTHSHTRTYAHMHAHTHTHTLVGGRAWWGVGRGV